MRDVLDAEAVRRWCAAALAGLSRHEHEINQLNVYPVPDGDTGTNLVRTLSAASDALLAADRMGDMAAPVPSAAPAASVPSAAPTASVPPVAPVSPAEAIPSVPLTASVPLGRPDSEGGESGEPPGAALRTMARGALLGARGNSGVIMAQMLRGLADALVTVPAIRGHDLADALTAAAKASYAAVAVPVEGTILSVASAAARAATAADSDDLVAVSGAAAAAADAALARTPGQLPVLAAAGVVDAGGRGLVVVLDALVEAIVGGSPQRPAPAPPPPRASLTGARESGSGEFAYEVQYLLDAGDEAVARLRTVLGGLGDSLVVVGTGEGTWNVHVHVNDVGAAVEAGVVAGRPYQISVTRFEDAPHPRRSPEPGALSVPSLSIPPLPVPSLSIPPPPVPSLSPEAGRLPPSPSPEAGRVAEGSAADKPGAVVVASGDGLGSLFAAEGAVVVGANPSTAELLSAIRAAGARQVVVLPNDPRARAVADAAADEAAVDDLRVSVIPTRSPVQALAALAVRDAGRRFEDDVIAMAEAAGACRSAELCWASRDAITMVGRCRAGDVLGMVEGEVHLIGTDVVEVARELLDRLLGGGGELVTILLGAGAAPGLRDALAGHLAAAWPFVEAQLYDGGQPIYPLLVGVE